MRSYLKCVLLIIKLQYICIQNAKAPSSDNISILTKHYVIDCIIVVNLYLTFNGTWDICFQVGIKLIYKFWLLQNPTCGTFWSFLEQWSIYILQYLIDDVGLCKVYCCSNSSCILMTFELLLSHFFTANRYLSFSSFQSSHRGSLIKWR